MKKREREKKSICKINLKTPISPYPSNRIRIEIFAARVARVVITPYQKCFNRRIWKLVERGTSGNANAACHRATGQLVAPDSWYLVLTSQVESILFFLSLYFRGIFNCHALMREIISKTRLKAWLGSFLFSKKKFILNQPSSDMLQTIRRIVPSFDDEKNFHVTR